MAHRSWDQSALPYHIAKNYHTCGMSIFPAQIDDTSSRREGRWGTQWIMVHERYGQGH